VIRLALFDDLNTARKFSGGRVPRHRRPHVMSADDTCQAATASRRHSRSRVTTRPMGTATRRSHATLAAAGPRASENVATRSTCWAPQAVRIRCLEGDSHPHQPVADSRAVVERVRIAAHTCSTRAISHRLNVLRDSCCSTLSQSVLHSLS
jgi:hypothetical protein